MSQVAGAATWWINTFEDFVLVYFLVLNSIYLLLTVLAAVDFGRYFRRLPFAGHDEVFANPLAPGVSIIVPAFNEEAGIVENVRAMLSQHYPKFEVVVVDDGSTDATFARLQEHFELVEVPRQISERSIALIGPITGVFAPTDGSPLVVVRKINAQKSDALNAGLNVARMELVCMVDADSLLDGDALLRVAKPFLDDPARVVATGGVIRPVNGCTVDRGLIVERSMPRKWLARVQVVEYLRSFLLGRSGWSSFGGLFIISGAFGMFRRDVVLDLGGLDNKCMGEDAELVAGLHHRLRKSGRRDYRIVFVAEPVCWTEVPESMSVLARQRRRWSRGLAEVLWKHKAMMFNPRYGRIGLLVLPYYLFFELLGPVVELLGVISVLVIGMLTVFGELFDFDSSLIDTHFAALFALVAVAYGFLLSIAAITVEEFSFRGLRNRRDLRAALMASVVENLGYRQLHAWWRLRGLWWWMRRGHGHWGAMPRVGFARPLPTPTRTSRPMGRPAKAGFEDES